MKNNKIAILNYGIGNVKSIANALIKVEALSILARNRQDVMQSDAVILPGVGAFAKGMENLQKFGLIEIIHDYVSTGKPFLGICLGMQMLLEESEEFGRTPGLGLIQGNVIKLPIKITPTLKLPHISWNELHEPIPGRWEGTILKNAQKNMNGYFVHSYVANPSHKEDVLALTQYGNYSFCSAVHHQNVYGTQFHPEKSGEEGLSILKNFVSLI